MSHFGEALLRAHGFIVGRRDPNMNRAFEGQYMVAEPYPQGTAQDDAQGGDGVWCIVGDNLDQLIEEAINFFDLAHDELHDWEGIDGDPARYVLRKEDDQISLYFDTGACIWVEKQEGRIRVHCYCAGREEPINIEIYGDRVEVDMEDYLNG